MCEKTTADPFNFEIYVKSILETTDALLLRKAKLVQPIIEQEEEIPVWDLALLFINIYYTIFEEVCMPINEKEKHIIKKMVDVIKSENND